jgi:hypothetical protein
MPLMLNSILSEANLSPKDVRLIRHKDTRSSKGRSPYELWRDDRPQFEFYQSHQSFNNRKKLTAPYWAVFNVNFNDETMFCGLYSVIYKGILDRDVSMPHVRGNVTKSGTCDVYNLSLNETLRDMIGRLFIGWGKGALAWVQYANRNNKQVVEVRPAFREEAFPGFLEYIQPLSKITKLPLSWATALQATRGVYLLTCPRTKEQYVGSATGEKGFWGRWQDYVQNGHGGNVALKSSEPSDYQVCVLEVAGTSATTDDIIKMEIKWKRKLQSKEMGLNRN